MIRNRTLLALALVIAAIMAPPASGGSGDPGISCDCVPEEGFTTPESSDNGQGPHEVACPPSAGTVADCSTKSLLHFNGKDGSTVFTDETGKTWYAAGNATISTQESRFGGASLYLDGRGAYLHAADSPDWDLGPEFTVDFWIRFVQVNPEYTVIVGSNAMDSRYYLPGWCVMYDRFNGALLRTGYHNGTAWRTDTRTEWVPSLNTWYHIAVTRDAEGTLRHFINGNLVTASENSAPFTSGRQGLFIGGINGQSASSFNAYIDEVRISKGSARWTSGFTPPDHEYGPYAPVAGFTASPLTGGSPLTVQFTDISENDPVSWSWDFGDGNSTNSTARNPVHTYTDAGTYAVHLTVSNAAGSDTL